MRYLWIVVSLSLATACAGRKEGDTCSSTGQCARGLTCCGGACRDTAKDINHCGACLQPCGTANAGAICQAGACRLACNAGFGDCNQSAADGCEVALATTAAHCRACNAACSYANAAGVCQAGSCSMGTCTTGYADCDRQAGNGCEVNTATSATNCGACGNACVVPHASPRCVGGACAVGTCDTSYGDCDGEPDGGCESNLRTSSAHCGACGNGCDAGLSCDEGTCKPSELLLFGGFVDLNATVPSGETWRFNLGTKAWAKVTTDADGGVPAARGFHAAAWDKGGNRLLVLGGYDGSDLVTGELWALDFSTDPPAWRQVTTTGSPPTARVGAMGGWDPTARKWYLFGGLDDLQAGSVLGDVYVFDAATNNWTSLAPGGSAPPGRVYGASAFDGPTNRFLLHGGIDDPGTDLDGLWALDVSGASPAWVQISATTPPTARSGHVFFDGASPPVLFGGGEDLFGFAPVLRNDVYSLGANPAAWTLLSPSSPPSARAFMMGAALGTGRYVFGGIAFDASGNPVLNSDVWSLDVAGPRWTRLHSGSGGGVPTVTNGATLVGRY